MINYIVEKINDEYQIAFTIEGDTPTPKGNYRKIKGEEFSHPKVVEIDGTLSMVEDTKSKDISDKYNTMSDDVDSGMSLVFSTSNKDSAIRHAATIEAMLKRPASYISAKLGLATEQDVLNYANAQISILDAYALSVLERIQDFRIERENILNG